MSKGFKILTGLLGAPAATTPPPDPDPPLDITVKITTVGDSNTFGLKTANPATDAWPVLIGDEYPTGVTVANLGRSGYTTLNWLQGTSPAEIAAEFDGTKDLNILTLMIGTNDWIANDPINRQTFAETQQNIIDIIDIAKTAGFQKVLLIAPAEPEHNWIYGDYNDRLHTNSLRLSNWLAENMTTIGADEFVDVLADPYVGNYRVNEGNNQPYWLHSESPGYDYVHYGNQGHERFRDIIKPKIDILIAGTEKETMPRTAYVQVTEASGSIQLDWAAVTGASGFKVYVASSLLGTQTQVYSGTGTTYTHTVANGNRRFFFVVTEGTGKHNSSPFITDGTSAATQLATPANFTAVINGTYDHDLSWDAVAGATGYKIYRNSVDDVDTDIPIATPTTNSYEDTRPLGEVYYRVVAVDHGNKRRSAPAAATAS